MEVARGGLRLHLSEHHGDVLPAAVCDLGGEVRIAISGTHRVGKTTLIEAFAEARPEYRSEPEPYVALVNEWGEEFGDDLALEGFERQLRYHAERVAASAVEPNVMFDRCAADFLAYMKASAARELGDGQLPEEAIRVAQQALEGIDVIVHLPLRLSRGFVADDEDESYRRSVDQYLASVLADDSLGLFSSTSAPQVIQLGGSTPRRLRRLLAYVEQIGRGAGPSL
jgi:hypothetical protein